MAIMRLDAKRLNLPRKSIILAKPPIDEIDTSDRTPWVDPDWDQPTQNDMLNIKLDWDQ